jgi:hypothetical protein
VDDNAESEQGEETVIIEAEKFSNGVFYMLTVKNIPLNEVKILVNDTIGTLHSHAVSFSEYQGESRSDKGVRIWIPASITVGTGFGRTIAELAKLEGMS